MKDKTKNTPQVLLRRALLVLLDAAIVAFSFYFALLLRADGAVEAGWWPHNRALLYENLPWIVAVYIVCFLAGGLYSVLWKYAGERDLIRLAGMIAVPTAVVYVVNRRFIHGVLFNSANCMASVLIFLFIGGSRLAWRLFLNHPLGERMRKVPAKDPNRPVLIVGAGEAGAWAINVCKSNKEYGHAVVAVDDDPAKLNQTIHGVPVKGTLEQIPQLCTQYNIHNIIIAIPTLRGSRLNHVIDLCVSTHCPVQILSDPQLVGSNGPQQGAFRELNTADFLSREDKLRVIHEFAVNGNISWTTVKPDKYGDWLNQRDDSFCMFAPIGLEKIKAPTGLFEIYSQGILTARDSWAYSFGRECFNEYAIHDRCVQRQSGRKPT